MVAMKEGRLADQKKQLKCETNMLTFILCYFISYFTLMKNGQMSLVLNQIANHVCQYYISPIILVVGCWGATIETSVISVRHQSVFRLLH